MLDPSKIIHKAKSSAFYLWLLNWFLSRMIPFNKPHRFRIEKVSDDGIKIILPYRGTNLNHIKGLHACALATLAEYTTGFYLISKLGMNAYRIILQKLEIEYLYQGKTDAVADFTMTEDEFQTQILKPLQQEGVASSICFIKIHDEKGNQLCSAHVTWQFKDWSKVKTKT